MQRTFLPYISYLVPGGDSVGPDHCGYVLNSYIVDPAYLLAHFGVNAPQLLQDLDGSFYAQMTATAGNTSESSALARIDGSSLTLVDTLASEDSQDSGTAERTYRALEAETEGSPVTACSF